MPRFFPQSRSFISEMEFRIKVLFYLLIANLEHLSKILLDSDRLTTTTKQGGNNECMRGFYGWLYARFFLIKCAIFLMFEGLPETSEEGLTLELSVFESLYGGQFELSTKLIKRKSLCYTLHWSSTIVVLRNLPPFTLTFSSVNKRCLWVTVLSIRFGVRGYLGKAPAGEWYEKQFPSLWPIGSTANKPAKNEVSVL